MLHHLMLIPSQNCPAHCGYCFGPREKSPMITGETFETALTWVHELLGDQSGNPLDVVFHGGEPLLAGELFYRRALPRLRQFFSNQRLRLGVQSNLWLLTDELCELFAEYRVSLGTSLDGPEAINDAQRGQGYFHRTMAGIERARRHGLSVGCICTFTPSSAPRYKEIFDFFARERLDFSIHAAVPALDSRTTLTSHINPATFARNAKKWPEIKADIWSLSPETYGDLLTNLLDLYLVNLNRVRISTLDALCRSVSAGEGGVCTFRDCLGHFLAIAPDGAIYPCQRFVGRPDFRLGAVQDRPAWEQLEQSSAWRLLRRRQEQVKVKCNDCLEFAHCKGGCPYDALAAKGGYTGRDPYCSAYRRIFSTITDRALAEVFSETNLNEVVSNSTAGSLLRRGPLLTLMRGGPHPTDSTRRARELVATVAIAVSTTPEEAVNRLDCAGLITHREQAIASLTALRQRLTAKPQRLSRLHLHVTYGCNLSCTHCYAGAGPERALLKKTLPVEDVIRLTQQAKARGFRQVVITGGEPLVHPQRDSLLDALAELRTTVKPMQTVLRTNLAVSLPPALLQRVAHSTDQVVISVDGDRLSHDRQRGTGSYDRTVANLHALIEAGPSAQIMLTSVLTTEQAVGMPGQAVKTLAKELGGLSIRIKPALPLGRASQCEYPSGLHRHWKTSQTKDAPLDGFRPQITCGIGHNLTVDPAGESYPCHALLHQSYALGNVRGPDGLEAVIESEPFQSLFGYTVDSNHQCRQCALRYLCGGGCRAWDNFPAAPLNERLNSSPADCSILFKQSEALLSNALEILEVSPERWLAAGLPLSEEIN